MYFRPSLSQATVTYITQRLIQGVVVLLAVSFICFIILRYMGDAVLSLAGRYATFQEREIVRTY